MIASATMAVLLALPAQGPEGWSYVEELRLSGSREEAPLSRVTDLVVGPDGRIYLTQAYQPEVLVLSQNGEPIDRIGREGKGPGEFQAPGMLGFVGDDLWVQDLLLGRVTVGPDPIRAWVVGAAHAPSGAAVTPIMMIGRTAALAQLYAPTPTNARSGPQTLELFLIDTETDSVKAIRTITKDQQQFSLPLPGGSSAIGFSPLIWSTLTVPRRDTAGFLTADQSKDGGLVVGWYDAEGAQQRLVNVVVPSKRIDGAERKWLISAMATNLEGLPLSRSQLMKGLKEHLPLGERYPPVSRVVSSTDGTVWLRTGAVGWLEGRGDRKTLRNLSTPMRHTG
jgi:6-bladed beta-propeller